MGPDLPLRSGPVPSASNWAASSSSGSMPDGSTLPPPGPSSCLRLNFVRETPRPFIFSSGDAATLTSRNRLASRIVRPKARKTREIMVLDYRSIDSQFEMITDSKFLESQFQLKERRHDASQTYYIPFCFASFNRGFSTPAWMTSRRMKRAGQATECLEELKRDGGKRWWVVAKPLSSTRHA